MTTEVSEIPLSVMVVDDEALARSRLRSLLTECPSPRCVCVAEAEGALQAIALIQTTPCDVALIDIHMPSIDGLQLARELRTMVPDLAVIFVTAHAEHALAAFDLDVLDYLTKPVRRERLEKALAKVATKMQQKALQVVSNPEFVSLNDHVIIQDRGRTERVPLSQVLYFKAELKYVTVRTESKSYILDGSLSDLEQRYGELFLRIHRNALVAKRAMRVLERFHEKKKEGGDDVDLDDEQEAGDVEGWAVRLRGVDEALIVSRRQISAVRAAIASV